MPVQASACICAIALCWLSSSVSTDGVRVCGSWHTRTHPCPLEGAQLFNHQDKALCAGTQRLEFCSSASLQSQSGEQHQKLGEEGRRQAARGGPQLHQPRSPCSSHSFSESCLQLLSSCGTLSPSPFLLPPELLPSFSPHLPNTLAPSGPPLPHAASAPPFPLSDTCTVISVPLPLSSTGAVRASSIFPILSVILLFMGGLCIAASEFYKTRHNIILSAGIFFVSAGNGTRVGWALGHGWAVSQPQ